MDWKETIQWIISTGVSFLDVVRLRDDLVQLRTSLPRARSLIHRADWGRFKNKDLAALFTQLRDTCLDAEDLLREFEYQELRQKIHTADTGKTGQLFSYSANFARNLYQGSKSKVITIQTKLDKVATKLEGLLNLLGLNVEPLQLGKPLMPETSSMIKEPVVFGRDGERDLVIDLMCVQLRSSSSCSYGKSAKIDGSTPEPIAKRLRGERVAEQDWAVGL